MTREEILQGAEIMKAYVEGKQLQYKYYTFDAWTDCDNPQFNFELFQYRIKPEVKEPTYRPYKDCDEMIADIDERFRGCRTTYCTMPSIWIRRKATGTMYLITCFGTLDINTCSNSYTMEEALVNFTYLDGSPVGKMEEL